MMAHHKVSPHEKGYKTIDGHKYEQAYKYLPYINMLNKTIDYEPVCVYYEF